MFPQYNNFSVSFLVFLFFCRALPTGLQYKCLDTVGYHSVCQVVRNIQRPRCLSRKVVQVSLNHLSVLSHSQICIFCRGEKEGGSH